MDTFFLLVFIFWLGALLKKHPPSGPLMYLIPIVLCAYVLYRLWRQGYFLGHAGWRMRVIPRLQAYHFPPILEAKLRQHIPQLSRQDYTLACQALRIYLLLRYDQQEQDSSIVLPSQAVRLLWREFVLRTADYREFCQTVMFSPLHYDLEEEFTPVLSAARQRQFQHCWRAAAQIRDFGPPMADGMPLLFALDQKIGMDSGWRHKMENGSLRSQFQGQVYDSVFSADALPA
ncbi:hypothetical protein V8J88_24395 [Massilia sp. W12]|uniref:hypothetical protein n=1 Tax=Massilia sp. W12 TaxID=3126507 RepID=UPI0030D3C87D